MNVCIQTLNIVTDTEFLERRNSNWYLEPWSHFPEGRRFYLPALPALGTQTKFLWRPNWGIRFDLRKPQTDLVFFRAVARIATRFRIDVQ